MTHDARIFHGGSARDRGGGSIRCSQGGCWRWVLRTGTSPTATAPPTGTAVTAGTPGTMTRRRGTVRGAGSRTDDRGGGG